MSKYLFSLLKNLLTSQVNDSKNLERNISKNNIFKMEAFHSGKGQDSGMSEFRAEQIK
jgi:hypothetical protein